MSSLKEICELAWEQLQPNPTDESPISKESFIATGRYEYAYQFLLWYWREKKEEGVFNMPPELSSEKELPVVNNEMDISELDIMSRLPNSQWLQKIGSLVCDCVYVKSNINQAQLLSEDDSLPESYRPYLIVGKKIIFPKGTHTNPLSIIYANSGNSIDDDIEVMPEIGAIVRTRLIEIYAGKIGVEDKTNNSIGQV